MSGLDDTSWTLRSVTAATTLTQNDYVLMVSPTGGNVVVTIPAGSAFPPGRSFIVRRDATATNTVTLTPASGTINGASSLAVGSAGAVGSAEVYTDGTNWFSLGTSV